MTYIDETSEEDRPHLERLRREILGIVNSRAAQETGALNRLVSYMGIVCSGGTIAILGFAGQQFRTGISWFTIASLILFVSALLSFALSLYLQFQLHSRRWSLMAQIAEQFFTREASLGEVIEANSMLTSRWTYRRLF